MSNQMRRTYSIEVDTSVTTAELHMNLFVEGAQYILLNVREFETREKFTLKTTRMNAVRRECLNTTMDTSNS